MKKLLFSFTAIALLFSACKEQTPGGLILNSLISADTTYVVSQIETPQEKKIVIEELTGVLCTNCPAGTKQLNDFVAQYPNRIILTSMHSGFLTEPTAAAMYDFRNADADALKLFFNEGDPGKPSATFDRIPLVIGGGDPKYFILRGQTGTDWISALPPLLSKTTPVNIHLTSSYDVNKNKVNVLAKLHFTADVTEKLGLTLYVLESGKVDIQDSVGVEIDDYTFNHVLQKVITPIAGEPILDSLPTKVKGRVIEKVLSFEPNISGVNGWNLDNCVIVGIVHKTGASKAVIHAEEVHLK